MTEQDEMGRPSAGRGIGALLGGLGVVAALTVGALALDSGTPAAASGLERFTSCAELETWTADVQTQTFGDGGDEMLAEEGRALDVPAAAPSTAAAVAESAGASADLDQSVDGQTASLGEGAGGDTGGTNTVVEGVDEIDVIDRVAEDRLLVSRNGVLALVELPSLALVAELRGVPMDGRITAADGVIFAAGSSSDFAGTEVVRARIDGDTLVEDGRWRTPGYLLDARRTGGALHVVAVDQPYDTGVVPFEGGPVPCDQVWHPVAPATTPAATLVATLPAVGELEPTAAAQVTGAGGNLLVTGDAVYVVTETYDDAGQVTSGIHRFELASLAPTGSGSVPGAVAGPFALSEHEGHLRVATSRSGGFVGRPVPIEGDGVGVGAPAGEDGSIGGPAVDVPVAEPAMDPAVSGPTVVPDAAENSAVASVAEATPSQGPDTTVPGTDTTVPGTEPTTTTAAESTTTVPETTTTTVAETTTTTEEPTVTVPADEGALAEVFVLDLEGDLDVVGTTGRFGHDFETIHGVRFVGDVGYVVTFLQTDPFWVLDLADPTAPAVVGELQIPGFSGYLHPVGDDRVVGFGPDGNGQIAARLFDVSDPSAPSVIDEITLGDDSPAVYDHHAFVDLGDDRFAVPVTNYPEYVGDECFAPVPDVGGPIVDPDVPSPEPAPLPEDPPVSILPVPVEGDDAVGTGGGASGSTGIAVVEPAPSCEPPQPVGGSTGVIVLEVVDGRLAVAEDAMTSRSDIFTERVVRAPGGVWVLVSYDRLVALPGGEELVLPT